jgi:hypothetical protein
LLYLPSSKRFVKINIKPSNIPQSKLTATITKTKKVRLIDSESFEKSVRPLIIIKTINKPDTISQGQAGDGKYFVVVLFIFCKNIGNAIFLI